MDVRPSIAPGHSGRRLLLKKRGYGSSCALYAPGVFTSAGRRLSEATTSTSFALAAALSSKLMEAVTSRMSRPLTTTFEMPL
jgi:hypothetical protein